MNQAQVLDTNGRRLLVLPDDVQVRGSVGVRVEGDELVLSPALDRNAILAEMDAFWAKVDRLMEGDSFDYVLQEPLGELDFG